MYVFPELLKRVEPSMALSKRKLPVGFYTVAQCWTPKKFSQKAVHIHDYVAVFVHILLQTNNFLVTMNIEQNEGFDHDIILPSTILISCKFFVFISLFFVAHNSAYIKYYYNFKPLLYLSIEG